jgi:hypothetical protein
MVRLPIHHSHFESYAARRGNAHSFAIINSSVESSHTCIPTLGIVLRRCAAATTHPELLRKSSCAGGSGRRGRRGDRVGLGMAFRIVSIKTSFVCCALAQTTRFHTNLLGIDNRARGQANVRGTAIINRHNLPAPIPNRFSLCHPGRISTCIELFGTTTARTCHLHCAHGHKIATEAFVFAKLVPSHVRHDIEHQGNRVCNGDSN